MAGYRHPPIAEFAMQLKMSAARLRLRQLDAIEYLVDLIEPDKHYPYDFVCHHITGYRPRTGVPGKPMLGRTLTQDLVLLAEALSGSHPPPIHLITPPSPTHD